MTNYDPIAFVHHLEGVGMAHRQALTVAQILEELRATAQVYGVYNAIDAMRRLEASGFTRQQAETLADAFLDVFTEARELAAVR